jgi:hypothetical protein
MSGKKHRSGRPSWHDRRFGRRGFLAGAAAISAGAVVGRQAEVAEAATSSDGLHGGLAQTMVEPNTSDVFLATNPRLFAGFTFIGQFIDHDITFDNTPLEQQLADPDARVNFRTPRYDLDSIYGRGPTDEPQFYDPDDHDKLWIVASNANGVEDMRRDSAGQAIIPEHRNDENLIVVQFHKAVAKFHNRIVDYVRSQGMRPEWVFETARRLTRWHYQWAVIHDFLPRFVGTDLVPNGSVYKEVVNKPPVINLQYYKPTNRDGRPFMPIEFAVAESRSLARNRVSISTADARSPSSTIPTPLSTSTLSWSGGTSCPSTRTSPLDHPARSTPSCRRRWPACRRPSFRRGTGQTT